MALKITQSRKQQTAFKLLDDPYVTELLFGGGAGGGKSWLVCLWAILQCRKYPGIKIGLGRKELSNLGRTTARTLLDEVHPLLGVTEDNFRYVAPGNTNPGVYYKNGSAIIFIDLAPAPSDPNFDRLGSTNLTHVIIEEAGEVVTKARSVFGSRANRRLNREYGITGKVILTCNPSSNFVRDQFYEPWDKLGGGDYQTWEYTNDEGEPIYATYNGEKRRALRAFVKSLPTDNPFLSPNYIQFLNSLPAAERRRLLKGDWDFDDDDSRLFKIHLFKPASSVPDDEGYAGCDPSRGGDACVFTELRGNVVVDQEKCEIPKDDPELDIGTYVAERYIKFCMDRGVGSSRAAVDAVGIGVSVLDACNRLGFHVQAFNAGSTHGVRQLDRFGNVIEHPRQGDAVGTPLFNNIRSQNFYDMAQAAHKGELLFLEALPFYDKLKRELGAHTYELIERQIIVISKKKLKPLLGWSPDFADSLQAAWWIKAHAPAHIDYRSENEDPPPPTYTGGLLSRKF